MSNQFSVQSHKGPYQVVFGSIDSAPPAASAAAAAHVVIDRRVAALYRGRIDNITSGVSRLELDAVEAAKSLERFPAYVNHLVSHGIRRDHVLVAIGGGIIQDIACFLAATLLRGVPWWFYPTTLLAQADSCIGSKSSINCGDTKNVLGTFTPPEKVIIDGRFLETLDERDIRSGVGEILKVHAIEGPDAFDDVAKSYPELFRDPAVMRRFVRRALEIKKRYIEDDEFDRGRRNVFNYGHTFGHAIEAATEFSIPHGIAVTIGMDMANFVAARIGVGSMSHFSRMHPLLMQNFRGFERHPVPMSAFLAAISKDKKNVGSGSVSLILPDRSGRVGKSVQANDARFAACCAEYLESGRAK